MIGQHFATAAKHIRRVPYQAMAGIFIMVVTFFIATILALLVYASSNILHYFETRPQVIAFLKDDTTPDQVSSLQRQLGGDQRIKDIRYVSKEQALGIYKSATSDNPILSEFVSPKVFPASLEFSVTDLSFTEEVIAELEANNAVSQVVFTASLGEAKEISAVIDNLRNITRYIRIGGVGIVSFLLVSSFLILLVILGMRIASRREEIEILKLLGATSGFIRMPFVIEGVMYALIGSFLGWLLGTLSFLYAMPALLSYFGEISVFPQETAQLFLLLGQILGIELLLAVFLGLVGSLTALGRYLKV